MRDDELTDSDAKQHHLLLIGRPDSNAALARSANRLPIKFGPASFTLDGSTYANADTGVVVAAANPWNSRYSQVAIAGLSAAAIRQTVNRLPTRGGLEGEVFLHEADKPARLFAIPRAAKSTPIAKTGGN